MKDTDNIDGILEYSKVMLYNELLDIMTHKTGVQHALDKVPKLANDYYIYFVPGFSTI